MRIEGLPTRGLCFEPWEDREMLASTLGTPTLPSVVHAAKLLEGEEGTEVLLVLDLGYWEPWSSL